MTIRHTNLQISGLLKLCLQPLLNFIIPQTQFDPLFHLLSHLNLFRSNSTKCSNKLVLFQLYQVFQNLFCSNSTKRSKNLFCSNSIKCSKTCSIATLPSIPKLVLFQLYQVFQNLFYSNSIK